MITFCVKTKTTNVGSAAMINEAKNAPTLLRDCSWCSHTIIVHISLSWQISNANMESPTAM